MFFKLIHVTYSLLKNRIRLWVEASVVDVERKESL